MKWIGQHIWDFISRFRNDVYLEKLDSTPATTVLVVEADGKVGTNEGIGTSDVDSVTTTDGTYIDMTPNVPTVGAVNITSDLSAVDGTSIVTTRFLSKDNTWDIPTYTGAGVTTFTNANGTFISAGTVNTGAAGAVTVGTIDLSAVGVAGATTFLRGDNTWAVPSYTSAYTLPVATATTLGGVELGSNTALTQTYEAGVTGAANRTYPVQLNVGRQMAVSVPWTDTVGIQESTQSGGSGYIELWPAATYLIPNKDGNLFLNTASLNVSFASAVKIDQIFGSMNGTVYNIEVVLVCDDVVFPEGCHGEGASIVIGVIKDPMINGQTQFNYTFTPVVTMPLPETPGTTSVTCTDCEVDITECDAWTFAAYFDCESEGEVYLQNVYIWCTLNKSD